MAWLVLLAAGGLEIAFATSLKPAEGFTRLWPSLAVVVFGTAAVVTLTKALNEIPLATAYAVFTGIGAVGTVVVGILAYGEPATAGRLLSIAIVITGIIALRLLSPGS
jgi:quaternary ammonium compound-resistance protein SugE